MVLSRYDRHVRDTLSSNGPIVAGNKALDVVNTLTLVNTSGGDVTITLPPVFEAAGIVYIIALMQTTPSNTVIVQDAGDSTVAFDAVVDNGNIPLLVMSNTREWLLVNLATPAP